uniref:Uncharacterized protein n=1 Tax=Graphocephala atropunctata TaxID=36148 RepID=A0A1B6LUT3_9HEMI
MAQIVTFFRVVQRIYAIFFLTAKRWDILMKHVKHFSLLKHSDTQRESRLESVKAVRYQAKEVGDALLEVSRVDDDSKTKSEALSLAMNELENYEFLVGLAIWYDVLFA